MKRAMTATITSLALATPVVNAAGALASTPKKKKVVTTTKTISGPQAEADRWGPLQVTLVVKKTTTTVGTKKTVTRKITSVKVPLYPDHTNRSVFINQQALPMLVQEVLSAQFNPNIDMISGATDTSFAFHDSLQAALLAAKKA
jgi:uncharacterized protein with FMN-binding domain